MDQRWFMTIADSPTVRVIDSAAGCPDIPLVEGGGNAKAVLWPGNGGTYRTLHLLNLESGARTVALKHAGDSVYYVIRGSGTVADLASGEQNPLEEGSMIHIDAGDTYQFVAASDDGLRLLGGPCPADFSLYPNL